MRNEENKNYINPEKSVDEIELDFLKEFKKFRKENNLTQQLLSDYTGQSREVISRIESGFTSPTIKTLLKILGPLDYTIKIEKIKKNKK